MDTDQSSPASRKRHREDREEDSESPDEKKQRCTPTGEDQLNAEMKVSTLEESVCHSHGITTDVLSQDNTPSVSANCDDTNTRDTANPSCSEVEKNKLECILFKQVGRFDRINSCNTGEREITVNVCFFFSQCVPCVIFSCLIFRAYRISSIL